MDNKIISFDAPKFSRVHYSVEGVRFAHPCRSSIRLIAILLKGSKICHY